MKIELVKPLFSTHGKYLLSYHLKCPVCEKHYLNLYLHLVRSNCGVKFVEAILKSKGAELNGRKKAILDGWVK